MFLSMSIGLEIPSPIPSIWRYSKCHSATPKRADVQLQNTEIFIQSHFMLDQHGFQWWHSPHFKTEFWSFWPPKWPKLTVSLHVHRTPPKPATFTEYRHFRLDWGVPYVQRIISQLWNLVAHVQSTTMFVTNHEFLRYLISSNSHVTLQKSNVVIYGPFKQRCINMNVCLKLGYSRRPDFEQPILRIFSSICQISYICHVLHQFRAPPQGDDMPLSYELEILVSARFPHRLQIIPIHSAELCTQAHGS